MRVSVMELNSQSYSHACDRPVLFLPYTFFLTVGQWLQANPNGRPSVRSASPEKSHSLMLNQHHIQSCVQSLSCSVKTRSKAGMLATSYLHLSLLPLWGSSYHTHIGKCGLNCSKEIYQLYTPWQGVSEWEIRRCRYEVFPPMITVECPSPVNELEVQHWSLPLNWESRPTELGRQWSMKINLTL